MSYHIEWMLKDRILFVEYQGVVSMDDLQQVHIELYNYLNGSPNPLDTIVSLINVTRTTFPLQDVSQLAEIQRKVMTHPKNRWQVYGDFSSRVFFDFVNSILMSGGSLAMVKFAASAQEGLTFLYGIDPSLPQLPLAS